MSSNTSATPDIRAYRKRLRMTQEELAEALGVHPQTISNWERGTQHIQHPHIVRLALEQLASRRGHGRPRG